MLVKSYIYCNASYCTYVYFCNEGPMLYK